MPSIAQSHRRDRALVWTFAGYGADGEPLVSTVFFEVGVRWNTRKTEGRGKDGTKIGLDADLVCGQELAIGSIVWKGSTQDLEDLVVGTDVGTDVAPPADLTELYEVVTTGTVADLKGRNPSYTAGLKRYQRTMPTQV